MRAGDAVMTMHRLGFRFRLDGEAVKVKFEGDIKPDPATVAPLLETVRERKEEVQQFLRTHCPGCGGSFFWRNLYGVERCVHCDPPDWQLYERFYPQAGEMRH